ncbi:MAG: hypothetical protein V1681_07995 [Candidatus Neomarinimicrobiota bacterium]
MKIQPINLLGAATLQKRQRRIRSFLILIYVTIWLFSLSALFYVYRTNLFISTLYRRDVERVQNEINLLQPKLLVIEKLYNQSLPVAEKMRFYQQAFSRPLHWAQKLQEISKLIPVNVRLEEISVAGEMTKDQNSPRLKMCGFSMIDPKQQDLNFLNVFIKGLVSDTLFISGLERVEILQNRIDKKDGQPLVTFVLGAY